MCRMIKVSALVAMLGLVLTVPGFAGDDKKAEAAKVGAAAPEFKLKDTTGKEYDLAALTKEGKIVVLEWFNHECPVCVRHASAKTMETIANKYKDKGVVFLGVDSSKGHAGKESDINAKLKEWTITYPVLADFDGKVGKMYGAKTTPHMFIIHKDGTLVYNGAIDSDEAGKDAAKATNYVTTALDEILAGKTVSKAETKPYGCSVKY